MASIVANVDDARSMTNGNSSGKNNDIMKCYLANVKEFKPKEDEFNQIVNKLNEIEMERINRFRFKIDAYRSLVGRYLIRKMVQEYSIECNDYDKYLKRSKNNKPYVDMKILLMDYNNSNENNNNIINFNFNVSHHGMWVGGVSSLKYLVGIDIMSYDYPKGCDTVEEFFKLMRRQFSDAEWSIIYKSSITTDADNNNDELIQLKTFYHFWSLKEAYIKAIGVGLGIDLKTIEFRFVNDNDNILLCKEAYLVKDGVELRQWKFQIHHPDEEHVVSIGIGPLHESVDLKFNSTVSDNGIAKANDSSNGNNNNSNNNNKKNDNKNKNKCKSNNHHEIEFHVVDCYDLF